MDVEKAAALSGLMVEEWAWWPAGGHPVRIRSCSNANARVRPAWRSRSGSGGASRPSRSASNGWTRLAAGILDGPRSKIPRSVDSMRGYRHCTEGTRRRSVARRTMPSCGRMTWPPATGRPGDATCPSTDARAETSARPLRTVHRGRDACRDSQPAAARGASLAAEWARAEARPNAREAGRGEGTARGSAGRARACRVHADGGPGLTPGSRLPGDAGPLARAAARAVASWLHAPSGSIPEPP